VRVVALLVTAGLAATVMRVFFVQSFVVPGGSMEPLLAVGDRVLLSPVGSGARDVGRGDVVVIDGSGVIGMSRRPARSPLAQVGREVAAALGAPIGESGHLTRVIGLPGDDVACCDTSGRVTVNGRPLDEPNLMGGKSLHVHPFSLRVPSGRLWVMDDNRGGPDGFRTHPPNPDGCTVPLNHVVGRVVSIWWPWGRASAFGRADA
jgi:signal peptidase I